MKTYTEKEVVKLLADFGTHVAEQCTGKKLEIAGELMKWWKLNIPAVIKSVCENCSNTNFNETMGCKNYLQGFKCENFKQTVL